jgi:hexosaminidase
MPRTVVINDGPVYEHRGFLLDTARHYYTTDAIKRTIDTMAMVKMNRFHWHITDSGSFPMVLASHPELSEQGTFSKRHKYTSEMIKDVVHFAKLRGVLVIPEFDAPAHVSEGWQNTGLVSCLDFKPWNNYCSAPPCGQLDPTQDRLYEVLDGIYKDMFEMFDNPPLFHMGGDEVKVACWNSSTPLQDRMLDKGMQLNEEDFMDLWYEFQTRGHQLVENINPDSRVVLWTSTLTNEKYFNKFDFDREKYIIQIWTAGTDPTIKNLLNQGYDVIISNYDSLYLDCGFNSWVEEGSNWCAPYKGWHRVYNNNLKNLVDEEHHSQILGSEACFWSSISDEVVLDSRVWPRLSALAERLWAEPEENYRSAEARMLWHRERLVQSGVNAEPIQPEWCMYNKGECIL